MLFPKMDPKKGLKKGDEEIDTDWGTVATILTTAGPSRLTTLEIVSGPKGNVGGV